MRRRDKLEAIDTNSVLTAYYILLIFIIFEIIAGVVWFIILCCMAAASKPFNGLLVLYAFLSLLAGIGVAALTWLLIKPVIGMLYDIKITRYHMDNLMEQREEERKEKLLNNVREENISLTPSGNSSPNQRYTVGDKVRFCRNFVMLINRQKISFSENQVAKVIEDFDSKVKLIVRHGDSVIEIVTPKEYVERIK